MTVRRVPLDARDRLLHKLDALTYLGGVRLASRDPAFGGFSAMAVQGDRITLVSDGGNVVRFRLAQHWKVEDLSFGDLPDGPGTGWSKGERDSESLTVDPATGKLWIGFESSNAIWRYNAALTHAEGHVRPEPMSDWEVNGGPEAIVRMADGGFVVLSERSHVPGIAGNAAVRFSGDPTDRATRAFSFGFRPPPGGFEASDMAQLPDGRLIVLVRRISINRWFESKLVLIDPAMIRPGVTVAGREIAAFTMPTTRDNFEALAVTQENGATILWLASDDNRYPFQFSLLMKFRLDDVPARKSRP